MEGRRPSSPVIRVLRGPAVYSLQRKAVKAHQPVGHVVPPHWRNL